MYTHTQSLRTVNHVDKYLSAKDNKSRMCPCAFTDVLAVRSIISFLSCRWSNWNFVVTIVRNRIIQWWFLVILARKSKNSSTFYWTLYMSCNGWSYPSQRITFQKLYKFYTKTFDANGKPSHWTNFTMVTVATTVVKTSVPSNKNFSNYKAEYQ